MLRTTDPKVSPLPYAQGRFDRHDSSTCRKHRAPVHFALALPEWNAQPVEGRHHAPCETSRALSGRSVSDLTGPLPKAFRTWWYSPGSSALAQSGHVARVGGDEDGKGTDLGVSERDRVPDSIARGVPF